MSRSQPRLSYGPLRGLGWCPLAWVIPRRSARLWLKEGCMCIRSRLVSRSSMFRLRNMPCEGSVGWQGRWQGHAYRKISPACWGCIGNWLLYWAPPPRAKSQAGLLLVCQGCDRCPAIGKLHPVCKSPDWNLGVAERAFLVVRLWQNHGIICTSYTVIYAIMTSHPDAARLRWPTQD